MNKFNSKLNKENNLTLNKKLLDCIPVLRKPLINPWYKNNFFTCNRSVSIFNNTQLKIAPDLNDSTKELFNIIHKTYIKVKNSKKKYIPCINKLQNHNWMFPIDQLLNTNLMNEINNLPDDKIESFMLDYYSKDEFYFVKETFRDILKNLNGTSDKRKQGYMKMIFQMLKAFKRDSDNFILCIPCLFVIIEHLTLITDDYKSYQKNKKNHKKNVNYRYFNDKHIEIQGTFNDGQYIKKSYIEFISYNAYPIAEHFYLSFNSGSANNLNRNFLDHGKADLSYYSMSDFIKLLTLCDAFTVLVS